MGLKLNSEYQFYFATKLGIYLTKLFFFCSRNCIDVAFFFHLIVKFDSQCKFGSSLVKEKITILVYMSALFSEYIKFFITKSGLLFTVLTFSYVCLIWLTFKPKMSATLEKKRKKSWRNHSPPPSGAACSRTIWPRFFSARSFIRVTKATTQTSLQKAFRGNSCQMFAMWLHTNMHLIPYMECPDQALLTSPARTRVPFGVLFHPRSV